MAMKPENGSDHKTAEAESPDSVAPLARYLLWVDSPAGVQRLIYGLIGLCIVLFLMDFFWHRHVKVPGEEMVGFHAIVGFAAFTVIVLGAKRLRSFIRRDESYYAPNGVDAEQYPDTDLQKISYAESVDAHSVLDSEAPENRAGT